MFMGAIGWTVKLEPIREDANTETLLERRDDLVEIFANFLSYYGGGEDDASFIDYFYQAAYDERFLHLQPSEISFFFPDFAGCCGHSADVIYYWTQLAFACEREAFEGVLIDEGFTIAWSKSLNEIVRKSSDETPYFVRLRGRLHSFWPDYESVHTDDTSLEIAELTSEEKTLLDEIQRDRTSRDSATAMIAPSDDFHDALVELASSRDSDSVGSAIWYAANLESVSDVLFSACLAGGEFRPEEQIRWDARKIERMASRAPDDCFDTIRRNLVDENLNVRALATAAIVGFEREDIETGLLKKTAIQNGIIADPPYCDVAVSVISSLRPDPADRVELTNRLADRLEAGLTSESTEHDFVLAIVNLWIHEGSAPPKALETLKRYSEADGHQAQGIAQWGIAVL